MGDIRSSLKWLIKGLKIANKIYIFNQNHPIKQQFYINISRVHRQLNFNREAEEMLIKSLPIQKLVHGNKVHESIAISY